MEASYLPNGKMEVNVQFSQPPFDSSPLGLENELMEIVWQNGEAVLRSQSNRKPRSDHSVQWIDDDEHIDLLSHLIDPHKLSVNYNINEAFRFPMFDPIPLPAEDGDVEEECSVITVELSQGSSSQSNGNKRSKRKLRDVEESEYPSEDSQVECLSRRRVAEVHNKSERRRRDQINEKMLALQQLIPHSHKSDKGSMLDDAIEYMKSLQSQLQWWMGREMRMLHQIYNLPSVQNLVYMPQAMNHQHMNNGFVVSPFNFQNQMQPEKVAESLHFTGQ